VSWVEVFTVFFVSHLVGDYLLQTDRQALNKYGGLSADPVRRRALLSHLATYGLCFVPAGIWIANNVGAGAAVGLVALVVVPHLVQDDGRLLTFYISRVKGAPAEPGTFVFISVDQSFHLLALFLTALLASSF
jgi:hypothetical protein